MNSFKQEKWGIAFLSLVILVTVVHIGNQPLFLSQTAAVSDFASYLVAQYSFNEGSGTTVGDSSGTNPGSLVGNVSWVEGKSQKALEFPGAGAAYVNTPISSSLQGALTISAWVKPTTSPLPSGTIVSKGSGNLNPAQEQFILTTTSNGAFIFRVSNGTALLATTPFTPAIKPSAATWYHVVGVYNGSDTVSIYVNGSLNNSALQASFGSLNSVAQSVRIGLDTSIRPWNGVIDEVKIYSKALSASEVSDLYIEHSGGVPSGETTPPSNPPSSSTNPPTNPPPATPSSFSTYYIDYDNGNDANDGGSPTTAWKHVPGSIEATDRAKATQLKAGNTVLFKGGVSYRGMVNLLFPGTEGNPITYKGDGWPGLLGTKAIIDGSSIVTGWTRCSSASMCGDNSNWANIYYADVKVPTFLNETPALALNVYQNDQPLTAAQYPDALNPLYPLTKNFLSVPKTNVTTTSLTDSRLTQFGESLIGKWVYMWVVPNRTVPVKITGFSGNTITFPFTNVYQERDNLYAIVNSPHSMVFDKAGEYYLDESVQSNGMHRLYIWPLNNENVTHGGTVTIGTQSGGIGGLRPTNIVVEGFKVQYQTGDTHGEGAAIGGGGSNLIHNYTIRNNEITGVRPAGASLIFVVNVNNLIIENNYLHDTSVGRGIQVTSSNIQVKNNTIRNISGTAIYFPGASDSSIIGNTITDGGGAHANGISVYSGSRNVTVAHNTVRNFNIPLTFEHSSNLTINNNLFVGALDASYLMAEWGGLSGTNKIFNNTIIGSSNSSSYFLATPAVSLLQNNILDSSSKGTGSIDADKNLYVGKDGADPALIFKNAPRLQAAIYHLDELNKVYVAGYKDRAKVGDTIIFDGNYNSPRQVTAVSWGIYKGNYGSGITFTPPLTSLTGKVVSVWKDRNFTSDYTLNGSGPAVNAGTNGVDIGAFDYSGPVVVPPPTIFKAGDFNKDGVVNSVDFSLLASAWNQNNVIYDLNKDTTVNTLDYSIMVQNWTR